MNHYQNRGGKSAIAAYEVANESITVEFCDGSMYLYNHAWPGKEHVDQMKRLAVDGFGLNSYRLRSVGKNYAKRLR